MHIPHIINEKTITVILKNGFEIIPASHINFTKIKKALLSGNHEEVEALLNIRKELEKAVTGEITIDGNSVFYKGLAVPAYQGQKLVSMYKEGCKNFTPFRRSVERLMENTSFYVREQFSKFADYDELPIDEDGYVYAYKGVQNDYWSVQGNTKTRVLKGKVNSSGQIFNGVGEEIEIVRADVDDDPNNYCSNGVHIGSFEYASRHGPKVMLVKFDPKDVVSVPNDCNGQKCRVCHYWVVAEYQAKAPIKAPTIQENKIPQEKQVNQKPIGEYKSFFIELVKKYKLNSCDMDVIFEEMMSNGYGDLDAIEKLINRLKIAEKIFRYVDRKNEQDCVPTIKQIQSCLKSEKLKQSEIEEIMEDFKDVI